MLTGELRAKVDAVWNACWSGGLSNPLSVIDQLTLLLFIRRLDELQRAEEAKAQALGLKELERRIFPPGDDPKGRPNQHLRWHVFSGFEPREMFTVVAEHVFPFLRSLGAGGPEGSGYTQHMKDATFMIPSPALLAKLVLSRKVSPRFCSHAAARRTAPHRSDPRPGRRAGAVDLKALPVLLPPLERQAEFVNSIACLRQLEKSQRLACGKMATLFEVRQHRAFRGEL